MYKGEKSGYIFNLEFTNIIARQYRVRIYPRVKNKFGKHFIVCKNKRAQRMYQNAIEDYYVNRGHDHWSSYVERLLFPHAELL